MVSTFLNKKIPSLSMRMMGFNVLKQIAFRLLTKTEGLDDGTVAIDIAVGILF